jgi:hypothetical protein
LESEDLLGGAYALDVLIPLLAGDQRGRALTRAAELADALADENRWSYEEAYDDGQKWSRVLHLASVSAHLDEARQARALEQSRSLLNTPFGSSYLFEPFAPRVEGALFDRLVAAALAIVSGHARARLLAALAPRLSGSALSQALDAALAIRDESARATALAGLAPRLSGNDLTRALSAVDTISEARERVRALVGFLPVAPEPAALRAEIGRTLVRCLAPDRPSEEREILLRFLADRSVFAPPVFSPGTLQTIADHLIDVCTGWKWQ